MCVTFVRVQTGSHTKQLCQWVKNNSKLKPNNHLVFVFGLDKSLESSAQNVEPKNYQPVNK